MRGQTDPDCEAADQRAALAEQLARANTVIGSARPVLRLLLADGDRLLFCEQVVAHIRAIISHGAEQLLTALSMQPGAGARGPLLARHHAPLCEALANEAGLLSHAQAIALEGIHACHLQQQAAIDPVMSPLVKRLCAAADPEISALAMQALAAQARFIQHHRRMELPLRELPPALFHRAVLALRQCAADGEGAIDRAEQSLREAFDDADRRVNRFARLLMALDHSPDHGARSVALAPDEAGLALFVGALAHASGQDRDLVVVSLAEGQSVRLALALRAAGQGPDAIACALMILHPHARPPAGLAQITPEAAACLLQERLLAVGQTRWPVSDHG